MRPAVGNLTHGAYTLPTVKGPVLCSFEQPAGPASLRLSLELPVGIQASVALPRPAGGAGPPLFVDGAPWSSVRWEEAHAVAIGVAAGAHVIAW